MIKKDCPFCDKVVEGYTQKQVEYLIKMHILAKHKSKVEFKSADKLEEKNE